MNSATIWNYVNIRGIDECWPWLGCVSTGDGYGKVIYWDREGNRRQTTAHRAAWLSGAVIGSPSLYVCHRCDNRICCNPGHLFLGTASDNVRDMVSKYRDAGSLYGGVSSPLSALSVHDVLDMRDMRRNGADYVSISEKYGVSESCAIQAVTGQTYRDIPNPLPVRCSVHDSAKRFRRNRVSNGLCVSCGLKNDSTTIRCGKCKLSERANRAERKARLGYWHKTNGTTE